MIKIKPLSLPFPHKVCLEYFSPTIEDGERIVITGRNESGKPTLRRKIAETNTDVGDIPQMIGHLNELSDDESFNRALSEILGPIPRLYCSMS
jgi:ABC-type phosphate/phosphonate transport system ATPase subunit